MQKIWRWTIASLIAGIVLALFLKTVQFLTGIPVYILLLNIDYIPILNEFTLGEVGEFTLHLAVGIIIGNILQWLIDYFKLEWKKQFLVIILGAVVVAIGYYPVTDLSDRTPDLLSIPAFSWWLVGHLIYGICLYFSYRRVAKN